ncbi:hypothetical protein M514_17773 [Trichuris suis]|uniref:Uncharacterized protein n=1 Tax=Trichuris suis TaxID=68888 RepID=A0A085NL25_9BILA|nr:hypothetical protein M514_17773 [Trichuris suis]
MDQQESYCPYLLSSETTAKGTGLAKSAGKEDPDLSLTLSTSFFIGWAFLCHVKCERLGCGQNPKSQNSERLKFLKSKS